jgi:hypothetical protein
MVGQSAQRQHGGVEHNEGQAMNGVFVRKTLPSGAPATDAVVRQNVLAMKEMMQGLASRFTGEQVVALLAYLHMGLR